MYLFQGRKTPKGFTNVGNSCYMNSVLQCLKYCDTFISGLQELNPHKDSFVDDFKKLMTLDETKSAEIFRLLTKLKTNFKRYKDIYQKLDSSQEDANEFLLFILGQLHKDLLNTTEQNGNCNSSTKNGLNIVKSIESIIGKFFIGSTKNMVKCLNCDRVEYHDQFFFSISVPIIGTRNVYFDDCFEYVVKETTTDAENKVFCDKCLSFGSMLLQTTVDRYPEYLIIQIQRAVFSDSIKQCSIEIRCPVNLMIRKNEKQYVEYNLSSFVNYSGNAKKGHYTSTCKIGENQWVCFDDSRSYKCFSIQKNLSRAYLLFYKKEHYP